ncbi:hypothetical protein M8J76_000115 [Diaphorina citri]|nr:hypothetical protein M8J75_002853 [Diaphorina citri]KAI5721861.1 hypothetical protein M8J76_000115 [Diaphorina citri]
MTASLSQKPFLTASTPQTALAPTQGPFTSTQAPFTFSLASKSMSKSLTSSRVPFTRSSTYKARTKSMIAPYTQSLEHKTRGPNRISGRPYQQCNQIHYPRKDTKVYQVNEDRQQDSLYTAYQPNQDDTQSEDQNQYQSSEDSCDQSNPDRNYQSVPMNLLHLMNQNQLQQINEDDEISQQDDYNDCHVRGDNEHTYHVRGDSEHTYYVRGDSEHTYHVRGDSELSDHHVSTYPVRGDSELYQHTDDLYQGENDENQTYKQDNVALLRRLERKDKSLERLKAALKKKDVELKTLKKYKTMVQDEANCYLTCNCAVRNQQGPWNPDSPCQKVNPAVQDTDSLINHLRNLSTELQRQLLATETTVELLREENTMLTKQLLESKQEGQHNESASLPNKSQNSFANKSQNSAANKSSINSCAHKSPKPKHTSPHVPAARTACFKSPTCNGKRSRTPSKKCAGASQKTKCASGRREQNRRKNTRKCYTNIS